MKHHTIGKTIILLGLLGATAPISYAGTVDLFISPEKSNSVRFASKAPLETVTGETDQISGTISFDPEDIGAMSQSRLTVNLTTMKTGNRIRDSHMYNNHLHTAQYPECVFTLNKINAPPSSMLINGASQQFDISGKLALHGVEKEINAIAIVKWFEVKGTLEVTAKFDVYLSDFNIPRPQFLVMKLDEKLAIEVHFTAKPK